MSKEKAKEFVEKFYNDDDFLFKVIYESGMDQWRGKKGQEMEDEEQNKAIIDAAGKLGYEITSEEFKAANKEYSEGIGGWQVVKKIFHVAKVGKKVAKERKKNE